MNKRLLSANEVSDVMGVGRTKVYELMASGRLVSVKIGARRLVPVEKVDEYIERLVHEHEGDAA
jgi:excisionase family DNA binding protein